MAAAGGGAARGGGAGGGVAMHWFRRGLRLHDNAGLRAAVAHARGAAPPAPGGGGGGAGRVYPVFVLDGDAYQLRRCSALRASFLVESLRELDRELRSRGSRLYVASGDPVQVLPQLWERLGVTHLTFEADETGEPYAQRRDAAVLSAAKAAGVSAEAHATETLYPLGAYVARSGGDPANVPATMGAYEKLFARMGKAPPAPLDMPTTAEFKSELRDVVGGDEMLPPRSPTDLPWPRETPRAQVEPVWNAADCEGLSPVARGGEREALNRLRSCMSRHAWVASFEKPKTLPTALSPSTTALSPYLSLGCLSPRTMWHGVVESAASAPAGAPRSKPPVSLHGQLMWRDFSNLMAHSANAECAGSWGQMEGNRYCRAIEWGEDAELLAAWKEARTGYPWIDACMMQLRTEGWVHHLGRHALACFLTRGDLWQHWERGAEHFEGQLLDADYALNGFNWLWLSCSGFFYQVRSPAYPLARAPTPAALASWLTAFPRARSPTRVFMHPTVLPLLLAGGFPEKERPQRCFHPQMAPAVAQAA